MFISVFLKTLVENLLLGVFANAYLGSMVTEGKRETLYSTVTPDRTGQDIIIIDLLAIYHPRVPRGMSASVTFLFH